MTPSSARVAAVNSSDAHAFSKRSVWGVELVAGLGVKGDAHHGATVQHRSRVRVDPSQPNLRQVHLIGSELFEKVAASGYTIAAGDLGEIITTTGIDLLSLPTGSTLRLGTECLISITGLRNTCRQINGFQDGLMSQMFEHTKDGAAIKKAGVMAVVILGGIVRSGDSIEISLPSRPHVPLTGV